MASECMASRHGSTPRIDIFMVRYSTATKIIEIRIELGNCLTRVAHFFADHANVVVAAIVVHRDEGSGSQPDGELARKMKGVRREIERHRWVEMEYTAHQHPSRGRQHNRSDPDGESIDRANRAQQQQRIQHADRGCQRGKPPAMKRGNKVLGILRKTNRARSDGDGSDQDDLPEEKKAGEAAQAEWSERLQEVMIGAAGLRHRRAQFSPDHTVAKRDHGAEDPAQHRLWSAHRGQGQRDGEKGPDPDHV